MGYKSLFVRPGHIYAFNLNTMTEMFEVKTKTDFIDSILRWNFTPLTNYNCYAIGLGYFHWICIHFFNYLRISTE